MRLLATLVFLVCLLAPQAWAGADLVTKVEPPVPVVVDPANATVVFIRPSSYAYGIRVTIIDQTGRVLGESRASAYFAATMPAGDYTFIGWGEGTPTMKATVEAGRVYYVEVALSVGAWTARPRLFAVGPTRKQWAELPHWLATTNMTKVNEDACKAHAEKRAKDAKEVVEKGQKAFAEYDAEAVAERTLTAADGVPEAVTPQK